MIDPEAELGRLRKRAERERRARQEAEALAEQGTRLLYERGRQLQLLYVIADASSRAAVVESALQAALDELCTFNGWPIGHAYLAVDDPTPYLESARLWHLDDPARYAPFRAISETLRFRRGEGLPGRVIASGGPAWINDVAQDDNFPRASQAAALGLRGALATPVFAGKKVVAVLEFYSRETVTPEDTFLELMAQVGVQVGRTFERQAREEADRANRAKSEFLSRMSHELRTPLNAILGFGQLLELDPLTPDQSDSVTQILKGGRHLLDLINEVLDISRIEAGHAHLSPEPVEVNEVIGETLDMLRPLAAQQNIPIHAATIADSGCHVLADRQRLKQVLLNLLSNAIKYNRPGGSVKVECVEVGGRLRVIVSDTGAGIPAEKLEQLFVPFERLGADELGVEGTGLGLALSKRLAELMGGVIGVESVAGEGSKFWVEFALAPALSIVENAPDDFVQGSVNEARTKAQRTVLYIEDNPSNLRLVERLLDRRSEVKLLAALQAGLGLDLAAQHHPDLILLDLNLPDANGHDVLLQLRNNPKTRDIPVIILSADATAHQVARLLAAGAVDYLTKPLEVPKFFQALDRAFAEAKTNVNESAAS